MTNSKRILSIVLVFFMLFDLVPIVGRSEDDGWNTAVSNEISGETYHKVEFVDEDGNAIATQFVKHGDNAILPEDPIKDATWPEMGTEAIKRYVYEFSGWKAGESAFSAETSVTQDMVVTAQFTAVQVYKVTINYICLGSDLGDESHIFAPSVIRYYAQTDPEDTIHSPHTLEEGTFGHDHDLVSPDQHYIDINPAELTEDLVIDVYYKLHNTEYTIRHVWLKSDIIYDYHHDFVNHVTDAEYYGGILKEESGHKTVSGTIVRALPESFKHYVFEHAEPVTVKAENTENIVYAYYVPEEYVLIYDSQGGSYVPDKTAFYDEDAVTVYTYSEEVVGTGLFEVTCGMDEHTHNWTCNWGRNCRLTEHTHSQSCYEEITDTVVKYSPSPEKEGYDFTGWYLDAACSERAPSTMKLEDFTVVYAGWKEKTVNYTVAYYLENTNDGSSTGEYIYDSSVLKSAVVGSQVSGSNDKSFSNYDYSHSETKTVNADGSTVVKVYYKMRRYKINFNLNRNGAYISFDNGVTRYTGSQYNISNVVIGQDVSSKWPGPDYAFSGTKGIMLDVWNGNYKTNRFEVTTDMVANASYNANSGLYEVTYNATWDSMDELYYVNYWLQTIDGTAYEIEERYSQSFITNDTLSAKQLFGFTNITSKPAGSQYPNAGYTSSTNTYNFYYNRNQYQIDYFYKDVYLGSIENVYYGQDISGSTYNWQLSPTDERLTGKGLSEHHTFKGWFNAENCSELFIFEGATMPYTNLALYADFLTPEHTIHAYYDPTDATLKEEYVVEREGNIDYIDPDMVPGWEFLGWYLGTNGTGGEFDFDAPVLEDVIIYAYWVKVEMSITIRYLNEATNEKLLPDEVKSSLSFSYGGTAAAYAKSIDKFAPDAGYKEITLTGDTEKDIIIFYYRKYEPVGFTVRYVYENEDGTLIDLLEPHVVTKETIMAMGAAGQKLERITTFALDVPVGEDGIKYYPTETYKSLVLSYDINKNIIIFYYLPYIMGPVQIQYWYENLDGTYLEDETLRKTLNEKIGNSVAAEDYISFGEKTAYEFESATPEYVTVEAADDTSKIIVIKYSLKEEFEVTYQYSGFVPSGADALPETATYRADSVVTVAQKATAPGYNFVGWDTDDAVINNGQFTMPFNKVTLTGYFEAKNDTAYTIEHYYVKDDVASEMPFDIDNCTGTTGTVADYSAYIKNPVDYSYNSELDRFYHGNQQVDEAIIAGTGTLVIKLFYEFVPNVSWTVIKTADRETAEVGDDVLYTIVIENTGNVAIEDLSVIDIFTVDGKEASLTGGDEIPSAIDLAVGGKVTLNVFYCVQATDNVIKNVVVAGDEDHQDEVETLVEDNPKWTVTKTVDKLVAQIGDTVNYTVTVNNTGNVELQNLKVTDVFTVDGVSAQLTGTIPEYISLKEGESESFTASYTVEADDKKLNNVVTVGDDNHKDEIETIIEDNAAWTVTKTANTDLAEPGDTVIFRVTVVNTGNIKLNNLNVTDMFTVDENNATLTGSIPEFITLDVGEETYFEASYKVRSRDNALRNVVIVGDDDHKAEVNVSVKQKDDWSVVKTAQPANAQAGDTITYTITVANKGNTTLSNLKVTDVFTVDGVPAAFVTGNIPETVTLREGETVSFNATYVVGMQDNVLLNVVTVGDDNHMAQVETIVDEVADWTVKKIGPATAKVGDTVEYKITITNIGNTVLRDLPIEDVFMVDGSAAELLETNLPERITLGKGAEAVYTAKYRVGETDKLLSNTIIVGDQTDMAETIIDDNTAWTVDKTADKKTAKVGDVVTYTISVTNTGNVKLENLAVEDVFTVDGIVAELEGDIPATITVDKGGSYSFTASYTVKATDKVLLNAVTVGDDDHGDDEEIIVDDNPAWTVEKTSDKKTAKVGEVVTYTITVTNVGNVKLEDLVIEDVFTADGETAALEGLIPETISLEKHESYSFTTSYTVKATDKVLLNVVTVGDDEHTDEEEVIVDDNPAWTVVKTARNSNGSNRYYAGDRVIYTITITNTGNIDLIDMHLRDDFSVDGIFKYLGVSNADGLNEESFTIRVKQSVVFTASYYIQEGEKFLSNRAEVNGVDSGVTVEVTTPVPAGMFPIYNVGDCFD